MAGEFRTFLLQTWWHSQTNQKTWFDVAYPCFNIVEAFAWLLVAALVLRRSFRNGWTAIEIGYASLWGALRCHRHA